MVTFENGRGLMQLHPHPAFDRICQYRYEVWFRTESQEEWPDFQDLVVQIRLNDQVVAEADFMDDGSSAHCQNVRVSPNHQRRGLATAVYVFAEKVFGKPLRDFWGSDPNQTAAAKALWANPNRPFGR